MQKLLMWGGLAIIVVVLWFGYRWVAIGDPTSVAAGELVRAAGIFSMFVGFGGIAAWSVFKSKGSWLLGILGIGAVTSGMVATIAPIGGDWPASWFITVPLMFSAVVGGFVLMGLATSRRRDLSVAH
jgi:hypothetical protein